MFLHAHSALHFNGETMELNIVVWSLGIGICLCNFYIYYNKVILGKFIRYLAEHNAFDAQSAQTLENSGFSGNPLLVGALKRGSAALYGVVAVTDDKAYYIPAEKKKKAQKMFASHGTSLVLAIASSVVILAASYAVTLVLPWVISVIQNVF